MGTRSAIGYKTPEGKVRGIYCHYDGYIAHNGKILQEHYQAAYKVAQLVELGDMSTMGEEVGRQVDFNDRSAHQGQCVYYGRDRGESDVETQTYETIGDFVDAFAGCEYFYIYANGKWLVHDKHSVGRDNVGFPVFDFLEIHVEGLQNA